MQSPILAGQEAHDDYVKQLLDQRTARADSYGRLFTPSDRSDTPSVYSRSFFSPYPQGGSESPSPVDDYAPSSHDQIPSTDACKRLSSNSSLNLHEDPDSSYTTHHAPLYEGDEDPDTESLPRMSVLGPKMRFHSRAPWETDEDVLHEEDESLSEVDRPRGKPKFFNFTPTSPRISKLSRPSIESTRSEVSRKVSMDNATYKNLYSRATLHLHNPSTPGKIYHGGRQDNHLILNHKQSPTSTSPSPSTTSSPIRRLFSNSAKISHAPFEPNDHRDSTGDNTRAFLTSPTPSESPRGVHPYAHPDLVAYPSEQDEQPEPPLPAVDIVSSDSTPTVTASSTASSVSEATTSPLTPDTSVASAPSRKVSASAISGREISTPLAVVSQGMQDKNQGGDSFSPGIQNLHGWMEKSNTPGFSLISLEEARAQRARAVGQSVLPGKSSSTSLDEDVSSGRLASESSNVVQDVQSPHKTSIIQRTRARSISASAKAKNALHSVVGTQLKPDNHENESPIRTQAVAGKSLKHKKSGLMRLLIGNKTQDQDDRSQPPPVPVLPEIFSSHNHQQKDQKKMHRVPVPELTTGEIAGSQVKPVAGGRSRRLVKVSNPSKPTLPPLFITPISTQSTSPRAQSVLVDSTERPWVSDGASLSAPAHVVDFPALQLRPVSTMFDAQFTEHLIGGPSLQPDSDLPRTLSMTPISFGLPDHEKPRANPTIGLQDQPVAIRTLQQSMMSAKLTWQRQIWELEGQVRDLKVEIEGLKTSATEDYCEACGRGKPHTGNVAPGEEFLGKTSVVDRPRARTATSARFGNSLA